MSCEEFAPIIVELARERLMDASVRQQGLTHLESCPACAALLAEERALSAGLRDLAAAVASEPTPVQLEAALRAAFRPQRVVSVSAPAVLPARRGWWLAIAAALLATLGLVSFRLLRPAEAPAPSTAQTTSPAPAPTESLQVMVPRTPVRIEGATTEQFGPRGSAELPRVKRPRHPVVAARPPARQPLAIPAEYVTEFYPVIRGSELIPLDGGQIMRVQMPRAQLIPLGIPVNQERAAETVKADVLVSHDGLARAIRLVY